MVKKIEAILSLWGVLMAPRDRDLLRAVVLLLAAQQNVIDIDLSEADKAFIATTLNHELKA